MNGGTEFTPASSHESADRHEGAGDGLIKGGLKRLRYTQPFNHVATSTVRALLNATGRRSEFFVKHLHRVGTIEDRLPNNRVLRLRSRADDWIPNQVYWCGWQGYEPESTSLFYRLASSARVTLDVGAYIGFYTLLAAHANPAGRVYAFEPLPAIYKRLLENVEANDLDNVRCVASAVGDADGEAEFYHVSVELPTSSSLSYDFMKSADGLRSSRVPVLTLDRFVEENNVGHVDLVKIDTESTEPEVLRGMLKTINRDQPIIFCEVLPGRGSEQPLEEIFSALGYRYYLLTPEGPKPRERVQGHGEWLNYLFTTLKPVDVNELYSKRI